MRLFPWFLGVIQMHSQTSQTWRNSLRTSKVHQPKFLWIFHTIRHHFLHHPGVQKRSLRRHFLTIRVQVHNWMRVLWYIFSCAFLFICNTKSIFYLYKSARLTKTLAMFRFVFDIAIPESNSWRPLKTKQNSFSRALIYRCVSSCIHWRPWRAEVYLFISISKNNTIYKSLQGLQGHHEHTHN